MLLLDDLKYLYYFFVSRYTNNNLFSTLAIGLLCGLFETHWLVVYVVFILHLCSCGSSFSFSGLGLVDRGISEDLSYYLLVFFVVYLRCTSWLFYVVFISNLCSYGYSCSSLVWDWLIGGFLRIFTAM